MSNRILKHFRTNEIKHKILNKFRFKTLADARSSDILKKYNLQKANAKEIYEVLMTAYNAVIENERDKKIVDNYQKKQ